jgi:hypothetical protein
MLLSAARERHLPSSRFLMLRSIRLSSLGALLAVTALTAGCSTESSDVASASESVLHAASPRDLGKALRRTAPRA